MDAREKFLRQPNVAVLATVGPGRRPHAAPIWYMYEGGRFIMITERGSQKHLNVERNGYATLVIDRRSLPYYYVTVQGRAEVGPPPTREFRLRISIHYLGEVMGRDYVARNPGGDAVTIRLHPDKVIEFHGVAGRSESEG